MSQPTLPVQRADFSSRDEEEVTDFIRQGYVGNRLRFETVRRGAYFAAGVVDTHELGTSRFRCTIDYTVDCDPLDYLLFSSVDQGLLRVQGRRTEIRVAAGESMLCLLGTPLTMDTSDYAARVLRLPVAAVEKVAEETSGMPATQLRFDGMGPVSGAAQRYWRAVVNLVNGALLEPASPMTSPLLLNEMLRTVAVAALNTFPNTTMSRHHVTGPGQVAPIALRRAVAHIDAHADQPLSLSEIAAVAGTTGRALQYAFRRHFDTTPMGYVRRVRLDRAHRDLQHADPTRGDTVAAIAARWGFARADRFAATYRQSFGQLPSTTLRT